MKSFADWTQDLAEAQNHEPEDKKFVCDDCFTAVPVGERIIAYEGQDVVHLCNHCYHARSMR